MPISLKQYAGSLITPTDDALLYDFILSEQTGILEGCTVTHLGGNQLQVSAGRGIIRGRVFVIEQETVLATVSTGGTVNGRLIVQVDLENTETPISFITQAATALPALVQEDINRDGAIYELPLVTYQVTEILISNLKNVAPTLTSPIDNTLRQEVKDLQAGKFNATATRSGSVVSITGPEGAQIITFLTPSAFASGDTYKYNGNNITLTDLNNRAVTSPRGWAANVPVIFFLVGSKAFFITFPTIPTTSIPASGITAGTLVAGVKAATGTDYSTHRLRNIYAGTSDLTAGTSSLTNGDIYFVYE